jgi:hypothetical protein
MKKNFSFASPDIHPDRHFEAIKNELRKYMRRENRRALPEGVDYWDFDCRFGQTDATAESIKPAEVIKSVDKAKVAGWESFYMEILVRPVTRPPRKPKTEESEEG